ncbi:Ran-binding-domain-containing protein [Poronia punctata]|nr:Ran-binding-domain-containing protein [Poronia punctata]
MDAFLSRLSYHVTSYAVRSCIALTSTYLVKQGAKLIQNIEHDPLRIELGQLQLRVSRKIEFVSPILESIEHRYNRGDSSLENLALLARQLRHDIDAVGEGLKNATVAGHDEARDAKARSARQKVEVERVISDIKALITNIDDAIPLINLWVSAIGGIQAPPSSFSPSRLLQASLLVNVGDSQFILNPSQPMQIGPDFALSLYMLFRGHASTHELQEPYGVEEGQRKPMWQEVIHKARVRLLRMPLASSLQTANHRTDGTENTRVFAYQLQVVEDLDDGRLHTFDDKGSGPTPYDGLSQAGIREFIPIHQISKMFYADVGKILNIQNEEGASSNPVLLLKRDVGSVSVSVADMPGGPVSSISDTEYNAISETPPSESDKQSQEDIDLQIRQEMGQSEPEDQNCLALMPSSKSPLSDASTHGWKLPQDLDPEWIALEVFDFDQQETDTGSDSESESELDDEEESVLPAGYSPDTDHRPKHTARPSIDQNLITQLNRMSITSSRPTSSGSQANSGTNNNNNRANTPPPTSPTSPKSSPATLISRSPFSAIKTSLSLLEMLLRLTSLQEFKQTTHLAMPDDLLRFYLDESASTTGLRGKERWAAAAKAERKVGFDPYADPAV